MVAVPENQSVDLGTMRKGKRKKEIRHEMKRMEAISKVETEANNINLDIKRTIKGVENKESFICTFVDVVKQSERFFRDL